MRGLNHNKSTLLDFGTKLIEAKAVHFAYHSKYSSVSLYINSTVHSEHAGTYVEFTRQGKLTTVALYDNAEKTPWQVSDVLGDKVSVNLFQCYAQDEFQALLKNAGCNILVFFRFNAQVTINVPHTFKNTIGQPSYIKETKQGIELGYKSLGTYCTLPSVIKVKRVRTIQSVKLAELGIEEKGYYSHDQRCSIPKHQAKQAKRFFSKRFKAA